MRSVIAILFTVALAAPIHAEHCASWWTWEPDVAAEGYYLDVDPCHLRFSECVWSVWIYEESNGFDGLQRGDEVRDTTCHGMIAPDTIVV